MILRKWTGQYTIDLSQLLAKLRKAGQKPNRALLDQVKAHGQEAVQPLIEMALDENLLEADSKSPEVWAPLHAINILGELGAPKAVEPLLPLLGRDDDWLLRTLTEAFGGIGEPALAPVCALLLDRTSDRWARIHATEALSEIGKRHPELRAKAVSALVARLDPAESQTPDDETIVAFAISALLDLGAVEALDEIRRAFDEDRVDTSVLDLDHALEKLGLPVERRPEDTDDARRRRLRLRCKACGYEREHHVRKVYFDLGTWERRQKGEETTYSEIVIAQRITCPKCGAVDQYELAGMAYVALMAEMLKRVAASKRGGRDAEAEEDEWLTVQKTGLVDGRQMHPLDARDMYRQQVAEEPNRADLRAGQGGRRQGLPERDEELRQGGGALGARSCSAKGRHRAARRSYGTLQAVQRQSELQEVALGHHLRSDV